MRFDRHEDFEVLFTDNGPAIPLGLDATSVTFSTARRTISGRIAVTFDRATAKEVGNAIDLLGESTVLSIQELRETLLWDDPDPDDPPVDSVDLLRWMATEVRALLGKLSDYDTPTLTRIAGLAAYAALPISPIVAEALGDRTTSPIPLHRDYPLGSHEMSFLTSRDRPEALKRTGVTDPVPEQGITDMLGPRGGFAKIMDRFEKRVPQQEMAAAVTRTLNDDGWLLVEAGTGTGKSIAYLAPAARFALQRGERVVVSTNTKALQDQLIVKDVPDLQRAMIAEGIEQPLKAVVMKGRSNYLCLRRWFAHERIPVLQQADAGLRAKVNMWLPITQHGDRAELRLTGDEEAEFSRVSAEGEACNAAKCVYQQRNRCFLFRARRNAENAHLVIVNHALLLSDTGEAGSVLPEYERLVIDEAHHLEDQATSQFGMSVTELAIGELADDFLRQDGPAVAGLLSEAAALLGRAATDERSLRKAAEARDRLQAAQQAALRMRTASLDLFARIRTLTEHAGTQDMGYGRTLRITPAVRNAPLWSEIELAFDHLNGELMAFEDQLRWYLAAVHEQHADDEDDDSENPLDDVEIELASGIERGMELAAELSEAILSPSPDRVYWTSLSGGVNRLSLNAAPLHVGQLLRGSLLERMRSVVMTSATLTTDNTFAFVKDRLACDEADELTLESPFNYRKSALLYLVDDVPEPNQPGYQRVLEETLVDLGVALDGRTLVLFTSHAALRTAHRAIKEPLADAGITVLAQRADGSPRQLIEQFKSTSRTMLLGTSTFWEGVDVVGPALSALVITKLPFAVPSDPVVAARSEQFENPFMQYSVPQAVLRFKQGFGRLIRSSSDRGACVVLDRRAVSKRYGASFVQSLPHCSVRVGSSSEIADSAVDWIGRGIG